MLFTFCECSSRLSLGRKTKWEGRWEKVGGPPFLQGAHISSEMPFGESEEGIMGTWGGG